MLCHIEYRSWNSLKSALQSSERQFFLIYKCSKTQVFRRTCIVMTRALTPFWVKHGYPFSSLYM